MFNVLLIAFKVELTWVRSRQFSLWRLFTVPIHFIAGVTCLRQLISEISSSDVTNLSLLTQFLVYRDWRVRLKATGLLRWTGNDRICSQERHIYKNLCFSVCLRNAEPGSVGTCSGAEGCTAAECFTGRKGFFSFSWRWNSVNWGNTDEMTEGHNQALFNWTQKPTVVLTESRNIWNTH